MIQVYSCANDPNARVDVLNYYIKKKHLKIAGETPEETNKIIREIAESTEGFSAIDLMYLLDKAQDVANETKSKVITDKNFKEAFLRITAGRVSTAKSPNHDNELTAAHEFGHATTNLIMYNLAKKHGKPWHIPEKLDFISNDPRGNWGGVNFFKDNIENQEMSFEKMFASVVCGFGGHSVEKRVYQMDGSWGITQDLAQNTHKAEQAVQLMGMGARTGKVSSRYSDQVPTLYAKEIKQDVNTILNNGLRVSNMIIEVYEDFIREMAQKYKDKVGTGECLITASSFEADFNAWLDKQSPE